MRNLLVIAVCGTIGFCGGGELPYCVDGIYPHLAMFNEEGECGTGAVVPWAGSLWVVTYGPHCPMGSTDKLYEITPDLRQIARPESVGGTPANRLVHRETNQLLIGPYVIDVGKNVRTVPPARMPGRLTGAARHLTDPAHLVYVATMDNGLYELDMNTLAVRTLVRDDNGVAGKIWGGKPQIELPPDWDAARPGMLPGSHTKGVCTGFGRIQLANNGEYSPEAKTNPWIPSGVLGDCAADGSDQRVIRRCQFTDITTRDGIMGNEHPKENPIWSLGWDAKSVILAVTTNGIAWSYFRLPKGSHAYDGAHGWNTEWPRIRDIGEEKLLATMHGTFWEFPKGFSPADPQGIRPLSTYLKVIGDFCRWNDRIVLGCDDQAKSEFLGQRTLKADAPKRDRSQSNLWFVRPDELKTFGPPSGEGWVWLHEDVQAGEVSDPFLFAGYEDRRFDFTDRSGRNIRYEFLHDGDWVRVKALEDAKGANAHFRFGPKRPAELPAYDGFVEVFDDYSRRTYRFPNVNGDRTVICREVATERDLLYAGGVFYEVPADNAGGFAALRPIALADEPVRSVEARLGLLFVNGRPMALDSLWRNGTAARAYWLWEACRDRQMTVDARMPGGNVVVKRIADDGVTVSPDFRDTEGGWFYWAFRVTGAAGRRVAFRFEDYEATVGSRGPAVSFDRGATWEWGDVLQPGPVEKETKDHRDWNGFEWTFGPGDDEVWFAQTMPYGEREWGAFVDGHRADYGTVFVTNVLCRSRKGRPVESARFGRMDGAAPYRIYLTSRHHCQEASATYVLEGALAAFFAKDELGGWLRANVDLMCVPFVDKDGVVDGDQGKNRRPHDHCRDYNPGERVVYPEVRANMEFLRRWNPTIVMDLHSPWVRSSWFKENSSNEYIYQVGIPDPRAAKEQVRFAKCLERVQRAGLGYRLSDDIPFGRGWNTSANYGKGDTLVLWGARELPPSGLRTSYEIPFANARFKTLEPQDLRAFGRDVAAAWRDYLAGR